MDSSYAVELVATAVFAVTGVLAIADREIDVLGVVVMGTVAAVGGGTLRALLLDVPAFWMVDFTYVWVAVGASVFAFGALAAWRSRPRGSLPVGQALLYLDGIGVALVGVEASRMAAELGHHAGVALVVGLVSAIGGGVLRDVLAGRPTLFTRTELYATPVIAGLGLSVAGVLSPWAAMAVIAGGRFLALAFGLAMPRPLVLPRAAEG